MFYARTHSVYADDTALLLGRPTTNQLEIDSFSPLMTLQCHNNGHVLNEKPKTKQLVLERQSKNTGRLPQLKV